MRNAFVIRGFGTKNDSKGSAVNFDLVEEQLIRPAMALCRLEGGTTATFKDAGSIHSDMFAQILAADVVICDITIHNANVFYELGIRHALRKKHTVLIKGDPSADTTPFDIAGGRYLKYSVAAPGAVVADLVEAINASLNGVRETDSPIFQILPTLSEANAAEVRVVPMDFIEEVQRAEAAGDKGWLRLLADEVRGELFQWDGLRAIGYAQWRLQDYDGARDTWEAIRQVMPVDIKANLALANIYERLYGRDRKPVLLEFSNQAIKCLLRTSGLSVGDRSEALALESRNLKTLWRADFQDLESLEERRANALNNRLRQLYEAYRDAFYVDLNKFYPGLAALQTGAILNDLSSGPEWSSLFGFDPDTAEQYRKELQRQLVVLESVVAASIVAAQRRGLEEEDAKWAAISLVDLKFITLPATSLDKNPTVFVSLYRGAVSAKDLFAKDAVCRQLELFAALGLRTDAAAAVIGSLRGVKPEEPKSTLPSDVKLVKPKLHLLIVSGHSIDVVNAATPRFPAKAETLARALIGERILSLQRSSEQMIVLASAAPGTDILAHELCAEAKQPCVLCLPMPAKVVASEVFGRYDAWRNRFLAVVRAAGSNMFVLHEGSELPRWLRASGADPWERGNRWVLKLAESWGADRITLLAVWDHNESDVTLGGTAQMVKLARKADGIDLEFIDTKILLDTA